jgi:hypothetical protein
MSELKPYESLQEIFNKAYLGLAKQNWRRAMVMSSNGRPACAYRAEGGLKCAIGHVVPDELVTPDIGTKTIHRILHGYITDNKSLCETPNVEWTKLFQKIPVHVLAELQSCHDDARIAFEHDQDVTDLYDEEHMKNKLDRFAFKYKLTVPTVPTLELESA